jgi:hypothetical protein
MGIPTGSYFPGTRNNKFQQFYYIFAGYGVSIKAHSLCSNFPCRYFSTSPNISMEPVEKLVNSPEKVVSNVSSNDKVVKYYSENIIKITYAKVFEMDNIVEGFNKVKNKKSGGVDKQLKADITEAKLAKLQKVLKTQRYKPKPSRRVTIPKPGGGVRFLGIASTIDKIVQAVLVNLLTPIVEPTFSIHSYGFRPGKGCHDALFKIRNG